jgi:hypothetical protein
LMNHVPVLFKVFVGTFDQTTTVNLCQYLVHREYTNCV